ncbi:hypothetical protein KPSA3_02615 [Pseudomonas syringae pv. actinidiae]|uniref:Uncharacterized protein n=2 Tax=Pseudomonas syringae TaxID=317 RepID=A0AAN4Q4I0_PSESF|nr:hypothetical protein KPSA3_02615 [Pseudomonas syringae pv. actinidiae]
MILAEGRVSGPGDASLVREDGVSVDAVFQLKAPFRPRRLTLKDQSKQNPGSVSGPTSSGSFALTLTSHSASSEPSR